MWQRAASGTENRGASFVVQSLLGRNQRINAGTTTATKETILKER
jgi:hypothetical protein